ncbi:MAG: magnesium-translocating P-type ATPase [Gordonia sp. (in: high G+C Gram-positive bacteria)]|uniref:magnesium-translocating P-type ATPase n=1 Tax=Gordonia sp. (in: high G+C Gram-positive bacteria) TaxID=84139 RepID=UPI0039E5C8AB
MTQTPTTTDRQAPWSLPVDEVAASLGSGPTGLTSAAAAAALPATRARAAAGRSRTATWRLLARQFTSPIILILIGATLLSGILGDWLDAAIILTIVVLSGLLDFFQERGAAVTMDRLLGSVKPTATVLRDGEPAEVPFDEVVPGDVVQVSGGDILPADALVLTADDLELDQSSLTGETFPAAKEPGVLPVGTALGDRSNTLLNGTHVASGSGTAMVVATGVDTEFGKVQASLHAKPRPTGFERGMTRFGLMLARIMVILVIAIFVANLLLHRPFIDSALFSLSLAVGLTPQLLPAIVGISLSAGAKAIARHRVIVKQLNAIEDFGAMTVLCTDKTGTMTQGGIHLDATLAPDGSADPGLLRIAGWNATLQRGLRNPLDDAIAAAATAGGVDLGAATAVGEVPYDFVRKRLSVLVDGPDGRLLVTKGAVNPVLAACTAVAGPGGTRPLADARAGVEAVVEDLGGQGMRVLAVATKPMPGAADCSVDDESGLTLVGLLAFADPVKPDAAATVADFAKAGVSLRMITGDAKPVATHIAGELGLDPAAVLTGPEIDALDEAALDDAIARTRVYCETSPHNKEQIISALTRSGVTVGYMGDGINDAPALKAADVGISVKGAADVAADAASFVMLENDLPSLLEAMRQGRRTFANTMKYLYMTTSANFGNMISMAIASIVLPFLPLLASQILLINLLTDMPATAIATDQVDADRLAKPQRWNLRVLVRFMVVFGTVSSVFDIITFIVLRRGFHAGETEFQTAWFLASILTEIAVIFVLRTSKPFWTSRPSTTLVALSVVCALIAIAMPFPPIGGLLHLEPLPGRLIGYLLVIVVGYVVTTEVTKWFFWRRHRPLLQAPQILPSRNSA